VRATNSAAVQPICLAVARTANSGRPGERRVEQEPKRCRLLAPGAALTEALL
jgi:hypothetical protein